MSILTLGNNYHQTNNMIRNTERDVQGEMYSPGQWIVTEPKE